MNESNKCCDCLDKLNDLYSSVNPATPVVVPLDYIYASGEHCDVKYSINGQLIYFRNIDGTLTFYINGVLDFSTGDYSSCSSPNNICSTNVSISDLYINIPSIGSYKKRTALFSQTPNGIDIDVLYTNGVLASGLINGIPIYLLSNEQNGSYIYNNYQVTYTNPNLSQYPFVNFVDSIDVGILRFDLRNDVSQIGNPTLLKTNCSGLVNINISGTT